MSDPHEEKLYAAVGKIVLFSTFFEGYLIQYVSWLSGIEYWTCRAIMTGEGIQAKLKMVDAVFHLKIEDTKLLEKFNSLIKKVSEACDSRDHYAHANLEFVNPHTDEILVRKAGRKKLGKTILNPPKETVTLTGLNEVANSILKAHSDLFGFMLQFHKT